MHARTGTNACMHSGTKMKIVEDMKIYLPLSRVNLVWQKLDKNANTILDLGCGKGLPMIGINKHKKLFSIGADLCLLRIKECLRRKVHDGYVLCDVRFLPFKKKTFNVVLCLEVIEHLLKNEFFSFKYEIEKIATCQIILSTPVGFFPISEHMDSPDDHKSGWIPVEFEKWGYKIRGINGLRCLHNTILKCSPFSKSQILKYILSYLSSFFVYFFPIFAHCMLCVKEIKAHACMRNLLKAL